MMKHPKLWMIISILTIVASLIIIFTVKPVWGIDFVGGSLIEIEADPSKIPAIEQVLAEQFNLSPIIQPTQDDSILIRTATLSDDIHGQIIEVFRANELMTGEERRFESIGPSIGQELRRKSVTAITLVVIIIIIYLAYTFRSMKGLIAPWKFGIAAVYALIHDLLLVTACFVIFGKIWNAPIDTLFVTAQLAILGYSVNDTIVIFNRIKTDWRLVRDKSLLDIIDTALRVTLGRSLNTSFTALIVLIALLIFGGATIRWFIVALTLGIITGAYSSLFVAPPLLYYISRPKKHA